MSHDMTTLPFQGFEKCYEKIKNIDNNITIYSLGWMNHNLYPINYIYIYIYINHSISFKTKKKRKTNDKCVTPIFKK